MSTPPIDQSDLWMDASDEELRAALRDANLPTLLLVLTQFTRDPQWLREPYRPTRTMAMNDNDSAGLPPDRQEEVREAAFRVLRDWRDGRVPTPPPPAEAEITRMLSVALGEEVPDEYATAMAEEAGFRSRPGVEWSCGRPVNADAHRVLIIGAGLSGIATGVTLSKLGIDFTIVERRRAVGGVWYDNDYPGAGVDTPVHLYSYSFAPKRGWSRFYAKQPEILSYVQQAADDFGVTSRVRFDTEVISAEWDEENVRWCVEMRSAGRVERQDFTTVISCVGVLNQPFIPDIDGMDRFRGRMFHSARWPRDLDVTGKRVAVIGTGATSMQLVPAIADDAERVTVIQRSPQWVAPNENYLREVPAGARLLMEQVPYYATFYRLRLIWMFQDKLLATLRRDPSWPHPERSVNAINDKHRRFFTEYIERELGERTDLRDKVLPSYPPYGKRILMDNGWIRTVKRDDVELVQGRVRAVTEQAVVMEDGTAVDADVVVLATGFLSNKMLYPMAIRGRQGQLLSDLWEGENPFAYLGMTVPGFPNFFMVGGPNTALGHGGSAIYPAECCVAYIAQVLIAMAEENLSTVEVRPEVCEAYNARVDAEHAQLIWTHPGMTVWYKNSRGRVTATTPWRGVDFWRMTRTPDLSDYLVTTTSRSPRESPQPGGVRCSSSSATWASSFTTSVDR